jgi:hypothetical protein
VEDLKELKDCSSKEKKKHNIIENKNGFFLKFIQENEILESVAECAIE